MCHIHASLDVPQPTASRHLAYLRKSGLVEARRDGIWMHYRLAPIANPVIAAVVKAALHALTHTAITAKDEKRLHARSRPTYAPRATAGSRDHGPLRLRAQRRPLADRGCPVQQIRRSVEGAGDFGRHAPAAHVHPEVVDAMQARGIDVSAADAAEAHARTRATANWLITMGCGDECPVVPGARRDDWPIQDPKGQSPTVVDASSRTSTAACAS